MLIRTGIGYDVHRLIEGRPCIIGGVTIPYDKGLEGYSDADVLLHAICDAILGAIGAGDLGSHFPEGDPRWKNVSSRSLLSEVATLLLERQFQMSNIDSVVIAERPKIAPFVAQMKSTISELLSIANEQVSVKATTHDAIGCIGRGDGIAAMATCLIRKIE